MQPGDHATHDSRRRPRHDVRRRALLLIVATTVAAAGCATSTSGASAPATTARAATAPTTGTAPATTNTAAGPVTERDIAVGPLTFHARLQGPETGEPVVLLHGFPQSSFEWRAQQQALAAAGYRTIAFDQRGYSPGARPPTAPDYRIDLLVGDVLGVADALGIDTFHLVGHDWGAAVAWVVAATAPQRLRSLTAVSVPHLAAYGAAIADPTSEQHRKSAYIDTFVAPGAAERLGGPGANFIDAAFSKLLSPAEIAEYKRVLDSPVAMQAALNWYVANNPRNGAAAVLPDITVRTMFVYSTGDCCLGRDAADRTAEHVTGPYRYEVLDGVSHWVPEEAADRLNTLLLSHLRGS